MSRTLEAFIDEKGNVRFREEISLPAGKKVLVTILEESAGGETVEITQMSELALGQDWSRREEDSAWSHLQPER